MSVAGRAVREIAHGLLVLLGVSQTDSEADADYLADKVIGLRIFGDENGKMNLDVKQSGGSVLVVSQFTLYGDVRRGKRPSPMESGSRHILGSRLSQPKRRSE